MSLVEIHTEYFNKAHFALSAKAARKILKNLIKYFLKIICPTYVLCYNVRSNEPCQTEAEKRAVLAQSSFRRIRLIGRTPDRERKYTNVEGLLL